MCSALTLSRTLQGRDGRAVVGQDLREQLVNGADAKSGCQGNSKGYSRPYPPWLHNGLDDQGKGNGNKQSCFLRGTGVRVEQKEELAGAGIGTGCWAGIAQLFSFPTLLWDRLIVVSILTHVLFPKEQRQHQTYKQNRDAQRGIMTHLWYVPTVSIFLFEILKFCIWPIHIFLYNFI